MRTLLVLLLLAGMAGSALAGTVMLMGIGLGAPGGGGGGCSNSLDFSQACNSQYLAVIP